MFEWESCFEPRILERGWRYAESGAVNQLVRKKNEIEAVVSGSEYYKVSIRFDAYGASEFYCSCPYAAEGHLCKHMAAVLYEADLNDSDFNEAGLTEDRQNERFSAEPVEQVISHNALDVRPVAEMIHEADRSKLEEVLIELASKEDRIEAYIRSALAGVGSLVDINEFKKEIDSIFISHADRDGYINYYSAMDFEDDLIAYICGRANRLMDEGYYSEAFDLTAYAFIQLGNCDIDDDGQIEDISNECYFLWQRIIKECSPGEKERIKNWFLEHYEDATFIDYMKGVLGDFLRFELATEEELRKEIIKLDQVIEESGNSNKCKCVYTQHYGYTIEAIELRILLMKKLGMEESELDEFRRRHFHFQSVRKYFLKKAQEAGDTEEEIRLLKESKRLDSDSTYLVYTYSERLIELFHILNNYELEKAERREAFLSYQGASVKDFRKYREMCSEDEWKQERTCLIASRDDIDMRCELLAEEKMLTDLYEVISRKDNKLPYFNKYGFLLADLYAEEILSVYRDFVGDLADAARNKSRYGELIRYLKRMQQYDGGNEMVNSLCREWIGKYPTRKMMVQELQKLL